MKLRKFLAVRSNGSVRVASNKPSLAVDEIAIQLNIEIPDQLFKKPTLVADIKVDDELGNQTLISSEVINNVKELISDSLGLELRVSSIESIE